MTRPNKPVTNCHGLRTTSAINGRRYRHGSTVLSDSAAPTSEIGRNHVEDHFVGAGKMIVTAPQSQIKKEDSQLATNYSQLKMTAADGKKYLADDITKAWSGLSPRQHKRAKGPLLSPLGLLSASGAAH